jgi:hypothetical protein
MKQYKPGIDTFYYERQRLNKKIAEFEQKEKELFENYIKEKGIEIVKIEKVNHIDYGKNHIKFKLTDINGKVYLSVFNHNVQIPISDNDFKSFDVYEITDNDKKYNVNKRYTFYFNRMIITKFE